MDRMRLPRMSRSRTPSRSPARNASPDSSGASSNQSRSSQNIGQISIDSMPRPMLCLTIYGFRNKNVTQEAYMDYMTKVNGPRLRDLMLKHGIKHWSITYTLPETLRLTEKIRSHTMDKVAGYDSISQIHMTNIRQYMNLKNDPEFMDHVPMDVVKYADLEKTMMTVGYIQPMIIDGLPAECVPDGRIWP